MKKVIIPLLVLIPALAWFAWGQGSQTIASATSITLPNSVLEPNFPAPFIRITGTAEIDTITPNDSTWTGCVWLMPEGAWTTGTSGNISGAYTAVPGNKMRFCYDGTHWTNTLNAYTNPTPLPTATPQTIPATPTPVTIPPTPTPAYTATPQTIPNTPTPLPTAATAGYVLTATGASTFSWQNNPSTTIPSVSSWYTIPYNTASSTQAYSSLTTREVQLFSIPFNITVNKMYWWISTNTTTGTVKNCVYSADGATKYIDVTTTPTGSTGIQTATVSAVTLPAGLYYMVIGCATTCSHTVTAGVVETTATMFGAGTPSGKLPWHGQVTHSSGTCNATLGTVTGGTDKPVLFRLDN